jgi:AcrR family transcriptional regulator
VPEASQQSGWDRRRTVLLERYERIALEQFAARGFRNVTIDDIAAVAGVSARTLFRYFPTKDDFLVGMPRRFAAAMTELIGALEPSDDPLSTAWRLIRDRYAHEPPDVELMALWRQAATDAPDVVDRVRGERLQTMLDALTDYIARSLHVDATTDSRPRILAGTLAGIELAIVEAMTRSTVEVTDLVAAADELMSVTGRPPVGNRPDGGRSP